MICLSMLTTVQSRVKRIIGLPRSGGHRKARHCSAGKKMARTRVP